MIPAERPPEGLEEWARINPAIPWKHYLVYRAGTVKDPLTGINSSCVDAVCTACGNRMKLDKVGGPICGRYASAPFGFGLEEEDGGWTAYSSGEKLRCPACGTEVRAVHIGSIGCTKEYAWVMSAEKAGDTLVLYLWRVCRRAEKDGVIQWEVLPWEAYQFGAEGLAVKYVHWRRRLQNVQILPGWEKLSRLTDTMQDIKWIYCPAGMERTAAGTAMENSKIAEYMGLEGVRRFPVAWLRLYQRHSNAETLMTCPAARLAAEMIAEEEQQNAYMGKSSSTTVLKDLDWKAKRPWDILRLSKEETIYLAGKEDGTARYAVIQRIRKAGMEIRAGEEEAWWTEYAYGKMIERGIDLRKAERYLQRQRRRYGEDVTAMSLLDHWRMEERLGVDMGREEAIFPQNFQRAHQLLIDEDNRRKRAEKIAETAKRAAAFAARAAYLQKYAWEKDGILIRPAATEAELIDEGDALRHCVSRYGPEVAEGRTAIFFIRRTADPDQPWYTLEFDETMLKVRQNRGKCNCERTAEIRAFEDDWLRWVRTEYLKENQRNQRIRVRGVA